MVKQQPAAKKSKEPRKAKVLIMGESPMVEEYARTCAAHGYTTVVQWNAPLKVSPLDKSFTNLSGSALPKDISVALEVTNTDPILKRKNLERLDRALPPTSAIISSSVTVTALEQVSWLKQKHRLVGVCALPTFISKNLVEVAPTIFSPKETLETVERFFRSLGKEIVLVQDRVGMVLPRILCQIINEAAFALQEEVASPQDIDTAMKLGTNYPLGPIEWADKIGVDQVTAVLSALEMDLREERYRLSPLLKQLSRTGRWWKKS